jgi:large subunit ribosomal protein L17
MRHKKKFNHLGRTSDHRKAMLSNMAISLIMHKRINTTVAKAKALKIFVEPLITKSKDDSTHSRRVVFSYLQNKDAVSELFREVSLKVADRPGGYTRILKTGKRLGDAADMCFIELVDYNENLLSAKTDKTTKSTRRRRGGKGNSVSTEATPVVESTKDAPVVEDAIIEEETVMTATEVIEAQAEPPATEEEADENK